jgi:uncharacterized membrane protein
MTRGRLEALSDGVIAIVLTIMVLELKLPADDGSASLLALWLPLSRTPSRSSSWPSSG